MTDVGKPHSVTRMHELENAGVKPFFNPGTQNLMWVNDRTGTVHYGSTPPRDPRHVHMGGRWRLVYVTEDEK